MVKLKCLTTPITVPLAHISNNIAYKFVYHHSVHPEIELNIMSKLIRFCSNTDRKYCNIFHNTLEKVM